jgi:hypothetical protein
LVMPSCSRNSMIVVFKTGCSPSRIGPVVGPQEAADPSDNSS